MSEHSMSDTDSSDYDDYESLSDRPAGSNSIAEATDGSQSESDENSYDSDSDSQSVSTRSSSSYQTDVTVSSEASDNDDEEDNEDNMSSANSQASGDVEQDQSEGEYTPVELSSDESDDGRANSVRAPEEAEVPINQVAPPVVAPEMPVVVVERLNQNANPPPPSAEEPQPGPSNETENKNDAKTAKKRPASVLESDEEDEDQLCPICFDSWKGTGNHRIVSLKCGHLFGKSCVERWVRQNKKCPKCNTANKLSDIRQLFAPTIKVKEAPQEERLLAELKKALDDKRELELKLLKTEQEMKTMQEMQEAEKKAGNAKHGKPDSSNDRRGRFDWKYNMKIIKSSTLNHGGGRVGAYCPWDTQLSVSRASAMTGFGLSIFNCEREFFSQNLDSFHSQPIRDLEYSPNRTNNILLTCSLDKTAKMLDYRSKSVVQTYRTQYPIWSCCWDSTGRSNEEIHKISVGMSNGEIARYDIRMPSTDPYMVLGKKCFGSGQDITAIPSLVSIPAGFSRSLPSGALIACHLRSCHIFVGDEDTTGTKLPFEGSFSCLRSEPVTGHLLLSTKKATHTVFRILQDSNNIEPENLFEPVMQLDGGNRQQAVLSKAAITTYNSANESKLLVAANEENNKSVKMWSVSDGGKLVSDLRMSENVMDICDFSFNQNKYFAFVSDKKVNIYELYVR